MKTSNFLARGGEMGASTATFDWTTTSLGPIENWQPNLRITLATMLPSPLPMFLWWGPELISFYNDAFRLLADGEKFACALGLPAQRAWPTIWQMLAPEVSIVMTTGEGRLCQGRTVKNPINGYSTIQSFSLSPVPADDDNVAGVLVTAIAPPLNNEQANLEEKARQLETVIDSAELGTWDNDLVSGQDIYNNRLRSFLGFSGDQQLVLDDFLTRLTEEDKDRMTVAIARSRAPGCNGEFELEYSIVVPGSVSPRVLRAKGKTMFDKRGVPIRFTGTVEDVTQKNQLLKALEAREQEILELFEETPVAIATLNSDPDFRFLTANRFYGFLVGRDPVDIIGKPLFEALPEIEGQGFDQLLMGVIQTGNPYIAYEVPVQLA